MAIANSYSRGNSGQVTLLVDRVRSYKARHGAVVTIIAKPWESFGRIPAFGNLDSSNTVQPRVTIYVQRPGGNEGDLSGRIYNSNGGAITLVTVEYSQVGPAGPWLPLTILGTDPLYSFPAIGNPAGEAFNIPVEITDNYTGNIYFRVEINGPLGSADDAVGPFAFVYINPIPLPPGSLIVPIESVSGAYDVMWAASAAATFYDLDEATVSDFSDAQRVYSGPALVWTATGKPPGERYYRVRAGNGFGVSPWTIGGNPVNVLDPAAVSSVVVPQFSQGGKIVLTWMAVLAVDGYQVQEDTDRGFSNPRNIYTGKETSVTVNARKPGVYYYRVRAWRR